MTGIFHILGKVLHNCINNLFNYCYIRQDNESIFNFAAILKSL